MVVIRGVSPLRGFPVERRGIGHLVPILSGQRLAGLVRLRGGVCPSAGCQVGTVVQLVGPAPTLHDKIINVVMSCFPKDLVSVLYCCHRRTGIHTTLYFIEARE